MPEHDDVQHLRSLVERLAIADPMYASDDGGYFLACTFCGADGPAGSVQVHHHDCAWLDAVDLLEVEHPEHERGIDG